MQMIELQNEFAARVARAVKGAWGEIRVHYENVLIDGAPREIFTASFDVDGDRRDFRLPIESIDLLVRLKEHKPEGQVDQWSWLEFFMDHTGRYRFDFKYDDPPLIAEQVMNSR